MRVISVRESPKYLEQAIKYIQQSWPEVHPIIYDDSIQHCITAEMPLPQWYLLEKEGILIACAGLITNDFISRTDLYPWLCALFVEEKHRGRAYSSLLMDKAKADTRNMGFKKLYLSTDHIGFYEKFGWTYLAQGYHPWDEESRIYQIEI